MNRKGNDDHGKYGKNFKQSNRLLVWTSTHRGHLLLFMDDRVHYKLECQSLTT